MELLGIEDAGIWLPYLLAVGCAIFAIWFGTTRWNKDDKEDTP